MAKFHVSAPRVGIEGEFEYDFGANLQEAVEKFGEDIVFSMFKRQAVIAAQAFVRRRLEAGKTPDEAQAELQEWKPGEVQKRQLASKAERLRSLWSKLSEEERQAILAELKAQA